MAIYVNPNRTVGTVRRPARVLKYGLMGFLIVAVVSAAVVGVYFLTLRQVEAPQIIEEKRPEPAAGAVPEETARPTEIPAARVETPTAPPIPRRFVRGVYTVYIASHSSPAPASEEVLRWNEAGYESAVVEANNHYRVALGQYATVKEARVFAERMAEGFEYGYWIGRVE